MQYKSSLCSCIKCKKVLSVKGIHSHHISAHTKEGNDKRQKQGKQGQLSSIGPINASKEKRKSAYYLNPTKCIDCGATFKYERRHQKFCSRKCAASTNNSLRSSASRKLQGESLRKTYALKPYVSTKLPYTKVSQCKQCNKWFAGTRKTCSDTCKGKFFSNLAKKNPALGGNKNNRAYGWYQSPIAGRVWLESSYEYKVACVLDANNVNWIRPIYLPYGTKKYYADFYLIDYDIYLDPKNDYLIQKDQDKINKVIAEHNVKIFVLDKNQLTWESICNVLPPGLEPGAYDLQGRCSTI